MKKAMMNRFNLIQLRPKTNYNYNKKIYYRLYPYQLLYNILYVLLHNNHKLSLQPKTIIGQMIKYN